MTSTSSRHRWLDNVRLPRWLLPTAWPQAEGGPALARLTIDAGRITAVDPANGEPPSIDSVDLHGAPALPGLVDAHVHLDKAFTLGRMKSVQPGLLGAIDAMLADRARWTPADIRERASRGLQWAWENGVSRLRTHIDWWEPDTVPLAWPALAELAVEWRERVAVQQVSLMKLALFEDAAQAKQLARAVSRTGDHAVLGGFVHSTQWNENALRHLLVAAQAVDLDVDLHVDEELNPAAAGLAAVVRIAGEIGFEGRLVCGHVCALAAQPEAQALATLDAVARAQVTLVSLPATNLLLQDAVTGRTPRQRGITLVKEARERGIPLLFASDNVQDPFCRFGSFDTVEALGTAAMVAQLDDPFDTWSEAVCRGEWLERGRAVSRPTLVGMPADLVIFTRADVHSWPSRSAERVVMRRGAAVRGDLAWV